jgi:hypothetical protein
MRAKRIAWKQKKLKNEVKERDVERQSVGGEAKNSRLPVTVVGLGLWVGTRRGVPGPRLSDPPGLTGKSGHHGAEKGNR